MTVRQTRSCKDTGGALIRRLLSIQELYEMFAMVQLEEGSEGYEEYEDDDEPPSLINMDNDEYDVEYADYHLSELD